MAVAPNRKALLAIAAILAVVVLVGAILVATRGSGTGGSSAPVAVGQAELVRLASQAGVPVFWAGARNGYTYELTTGEGRQYLRYIPPGTHGSLAHTELLTIGTYNVANAFKAVEAIAKQPGATHFAVPGGGLAAYSQSRPTNVYVAYPGFQVEVEAFSPHAGEAAQLVREGQVEPLTPPGAIATAPTGPRIVSESELSAFAHENPFPVYWAGAQPGKSLELTRTVDGRVYVRYLPAGAPAGDAQPNFLTVGTYPVGGGVAAVKRAAAAKGMTRLALPNGTTVLYSSSKPTSAYFAAPGAAQEVEVFSPTSGASVALIASGKIAPVR
jgi:hypothetical protein